MALNLIHRYTVRFVKIRWLRKNLIMSVGICTLMLFSVLLFAWNWTVQLNENEDVSDLPESIQIFVSVNGWRSIRQFIISMKSMLYYQNRVKAHNPQCILSLPNATIWPCPRDSKVKSDRPIQLYMLSYHSTRRILEEILRRWNLQRIRWQFYPMEECQYLIDWIPNTHHAGIFALGKLLLPRILPKSVKKVISIDVDTLYNHDIVELWDHFQLFNERQVFGYAWEQQSESPTCNDEMIGDLPVFGMNGGVALMHLERMTELGWDKLWISVLEDLLFELGQLTEGEQQVIRTIIQKYPHIYYKLPCEWNVQVYSDVASECCHVIWPLRYPDQIDCWANDRKAHSVRPVKIVHFDSIWKPDEMNRSVYLPDISTQMEQRLTTEEIRNRFVQTFYRFADIPLHCFY
ncbi:hypothetical protein D915_004503 [Fasciola hepatica]|uniref:Uncharacterized protein n=1 Tax=Fasciola hepatica TaxID=6192 RepID=A0A4E0RDA4_FASHE|nr:hypothetical protein D915_004503 [Fasciola hepatica]